MTARELSAWLRKRAGIRDLADLPDAYALAAGAADFYAELKYAMNRIADHIDAGRTLRKEITEAFRFADREAYLARDAIGSVSARYRITLGDGPGAAPLPERRPSVRRGFTRAAT